MARAESRKVPSEVMSVSSDLGKLESESELSNCQSASSLSKAAWVEEGTSPFIPVSGDISPEEQILVGL